MPKRKQTMSRDQVKVEYARLVATYPQYAYRIKGVATKLDYYGVVELEALFDLFLSGIAEDEAQAKFSAELERQLDELPSIQPQ